MKNKKKIMTKKDLLVEIFKGKKIRSKLGRIVDLKFLQTRNIFKNSKRDYYIFWEGEGVYLTKGNKLTSFYWGLEPCGIKKEQENVLTGFYPSEEKIKNWMELLRKNGIEEDVECRLVAGAQKGKIVRFEDFYFNDLGVASKDNMGYFLNIYEGEEIPKVAKPIYKKVDFENKEFSEVGKNVIYGAILKGNGCNRSKALLRISSNDLVTVTKSESEKEYEVQEQNFYLPQLEDRVKLLYDFKNTKDLFEWLAI